MSQNMFSILRDEYAMPQRMRKKLNDTFPQLTHAIFIKPISFYTLKLQICI